LVKNNAILTAIKDFYNKIASILHPKTHSKVKYNYKAIAQHL